MPQKHLAPLLQLQDIPTWHQCHSPFAMKEVKGIAEVKELVRLATAPFFGQH